MAKPVAFGTYQFKTQKSATEDARRRISQYEAGERLQLEDELFFTSLFTLHSEYAEKKGSGAVGFNAYNQLHRKQSCRWLFAEP